MCGRAAQTQHAVETAAASLNVSSGSSSSRSNRTEAESSAAAADGSQPTSSSFASSSSSSSDNYNMSPGMDAVVFWKDDHGSVRMGRKVWGLVPRGGSKSAPLPKGDVSRHFSNLMFNARADTLYEKVTFARLAGAGKTCLIALDGFFEWKAPGGSGKGKKQPYYIYRKQEKDSKDAERPYLLMPGLWTSVSTGRQDDPTLETFTIITTDACEPLQWLHSRMPVCIWDESLALEWLTRPSQKLHRQIEEAAMQTQEGVLQWHAVSTDMSSLKFRSSEAIKPLPKVKTLDSFFTASSKSDSDKKTSSTLPLSGKKRIASSTDTESASNKKAKAGLTGSKKANAPQKKGPIDSFFSPKPSKQQEQRKEED